MESIDSLGVIGFHKPAEAVITSQLIAGGVDILVTSSQGCKLSEQFEVIQQVR
jgi:hypothetical protein